MSKELERVKLVCESRMTTANRLLEEGMDSELNSVMWREAHERYKAACNASQQQDKMRWTTSGDFSHLQSTPTVHF